VPLARADAQRGAEHTVNLHHEQVTLDEPARLLLPLFDGTLDRAALIRAERRAEIIDTTIRALADAALLAP
jgi:hypothetical protein